MRTIVSINIDIAIGVLRVLAAVLTGAALLCLSRVGPRLLAACLSTVLAMLVVEINSGWTKHLDSTFESWVSPHRSLGALAGWSEFWNYVGDPFYFAAAALACAAWFSWRAQSTVPAVAMLAAVGAGVVLEDTLKVAVERTPATVAALQNRPAASTDLYAYLHSFPSGHVTVIGAFVGTVAVCLCAGRRPAVKVGMGVLAGAVVVFVGTLAVYIRAHTFTDVVGGTILSAAIVAMAGPALNTVLAQARRVKVKSAAPARPAAPTVRRERVLVG